MSVIDVSVSLSLYMSLFVWYPVGAVTAVDQTSPETHWTRSGILSSPWFEQCLHVL